MKDFKDDLYEVFEFHLFSFEETHDTEVDFVHKVVSEYWQRLHQTGFVPLKMLSELKGEIETEVTEMLRKKIYGHFSLSAFRESIKANKDN